MKIIQQELSPGKIQLNVTVPPEKYEQYLRGKALEMSEKINIPGFRTGKAPYDVIKGQVGEMKLLQEALNEIIGETYQQVIKDEKIRPAMPPKIDIQKVAPGNELEYKAEVVVLPSIELADLTAIKIKKQAVAVTDEQVDQALVELRKMRASEALKDGSAEKGDKVEFDLKSVVKDDPKAGEDVKNQSLILGEAMMIEGFTNNIIGLKAGEEKTFTQKFPEKYHQPNYAGREVEITIKVNKVWQITLPEVNDTFATGISPKFKNLADLKVQLKKNLEMEREQKGTEREEREMLDKVIKESKFSAVAPELLADVQEKMVQDMRFNIERSGGKFEDYLKSINKKEDELKAEMSEDAEKRIKIDCILAEVMELQNIKVEESEMSEEVKKFIAQFPSAEEASKRIDLHQLKNNVRARLLTKKVFEWIKSQVKSE